MASHHFLIHVSPPAPKTTTQVLSLQLLASGLFCAYVTMNEAANEFVLTHPGLYMTGIVMSVVLIMLLMCYRNTYPVNLGLLAMWTFAEAYTIGMVTASFARAGEGDIVVQALAITFVVFFSLTVFTFQSRIDFSFLGGILFASTWVLIIWGLIGAIFGFNGGFIYALLGSIIFSLCTFALATHATPTPLLARPLPRSSSTHTAPTPHPARRAVTHPLYPHPQTQTLCSTLSAFCESYLTTSGF